MRKLIINSGVAYDDLCAIKLAGWDGVFTGWDPNWDPSKIEHIAKLIHDLELIYQSIHAPFTRVHKLWDEGEAGEIEVKQQITCLQTAQKIGVDLVILHPNIGFDRRTPTELGIERYAKIFDAAKQLGVRVAVENVEGEEYLDALMQAFPNEPHVGFCIDTGHEMCYNGSHDLIGKYGNHLFGTHLNDNKGQTGENITWLDDSHMLPFDGIADWNGIADRLKKAGYKGMLTFELTMKNKPDRHTHDQYEQMSYAKFVAVAYERARRFGELIGN